MGKAPSPPPLHVPKDTRIWVVGATGLVGRCILEILLNEWQVPADRLHLAASPKRANQIYTYSSHAFTLKAFDPRLVDPKHKHYFLFATESDISQDWIEKLRALKAPNIYMVDASSAYRMDPDVPLVIPELNKDLLKPSPNLVASPNCTTIGFMLGIRAFWHHFKVKRIFMSSYQAASGAGYLASQSLEADLKDGGKRSGDYFPFPLAHNCIPQIGSYQNDGYCQEERKVIGESQKILATTIPFHTTTARIPVSNGHSESVTLEVEETLTPDSVHAAIQNNDHSEIVFADPIYHCRSLEDIQDSNTVLVSRVRFQSDDPHFLHCWIQFDNLRIGAATNVCRILRDMLE